MLLYDISVFMVYSKTSLSRQARGESLAELPGITSRIIYDIGGYSLMSAKSQSISQHYAELTLRLPNDYESTCEYYCQILVCISYKKGHFYLFIDVNILFTLFSL